MKRYFPVFLIQILIIGVLCVLLLNTRKGQGVLSPELSQWESRYTTYESGHFYCDESIYPADLNPGEDVDFIYGPFFSLSPGNYSVSVDYKCDEDQNFQVYSFNDPGAVFIHETQRLPNDKTTVTYHFTLLKQVDDLEVRVRYNGGGVLEIDNISVASSTFLLREVLLALFIVFVLIDICIYIAAGSKEETKRQTWIDVCRGIGILLVLLGHSRPPFRWLIFGFHMPLFFILSGYLFREGRKTAEYLSMLFRRYIIPYFLYAGINLIITLIKTAVEDTVTLDWILRYLLHGILTGGEWLPNSLPLWFLPALFMTMAGMHFIHSLKPDAFRRFIVIMICLTLSFLIDRFDCPLIPWNIGQALMGIVFAEIGFVIKQHDMIKRIAALRAANKTCLLIILLVCGVDAVKYNYDASGEYCTMQEMFYGHMPLWLLGAVFLSLVLMTACYMLCEGRAANALSPLAALGRNTIVFFAFDFIINIYSERFLQAVLNYSPWHFVMPVKLIFLILISVSDKRIRRLIVSARNGK